MSLFLRYDQQIFCNHQKTTRGRVHINIAYHIPYRLIVVNDRSSTQTRDQIYDRLRKVMTIAEMFQIAFYDLFRPS